jgi:replicative DNA helicase
VSNLDTILSAAASAHVPPHALEAERAVLGALLLDPALVNDAIGLPLAPDDFYRDAHQKIYRSILSLHERGERPDSVTLSDELQKRGELEAIGGRAELARIFDYGVTTANLDSHARIVIDKALLRRLIGASQEIAREATAGRDEVRDVLDRAEARIFAITDRKVRKDIFRMRDLTAPAIHELQRLHELKTRITGLATGLDDIDEMTGGFQPGELIVVAGRPSMGKTALCLNIAEHAAIKGRKPVVVFSLEMSKEQLVLRMLSSRSQINLRQLRTGYIGDDWSRLTKATGELHSAPIWIDDTPGLSALELRAKARRIRSEEPLSLIVVDYLQLMRGPDSVDSRQQEISHITRSLKGLAKELAVPIIALSQLSRAPELRGAKGIPMLSDLRESGAIEQDADVVIFVYREEFYHPTEENHGKATIKVAKQRNGPTGDIEVSFLKEFASVRNLSRLSPDQYGA